MRFRLHDIQRARNLFRLLLRNSKRIQLSSKKWTKPSFGKWNFQVERFPIQRPPTPVQLSDSLFPVKTDGWSCVPRMDTDHWPVAPARVNLTYPRPITRHFRWKILRNAFWRTKSQVFPVKK